MNREVHVRFCKRLAGKFRGSTYRANFTVGLVEGISVVKMLKRIQVGGLLRGILKYNISQWTRNFTYGMYYAFSLSLFENKLLKNIFLDLVVSYGQYIVLIFLTIEIFIFFRNKFSSRQKNY